MKNSGAINFDDLQSKTLDYIRFPISIGVVFIHNSYGGPVMDIQSIDYSSLTSNEIFDLFRVLTKTLATIATPYFFLISGYFYFRKTEVLNWDVYKSKTINRIKTVLVPYIIWNVLAFLIPLITAIVKGDTFSYLAKFEGMNPLSIFWNYKVYDLHVENLLGRHIFEAAPLNVPLWFLRDLFIMSLLSPVFYYFVRKTKLIGLALLGFCFFTSTWTQITGFRVSAVFLFAFGAYFGIFKKNLISVVRAYKIPILLTCISTIILDIYFNSLPFQTLYIRPLYRFSGLLTAILLGSYLVEFNWSRMKPQRSLLAKSSFFIYVAHAVSILGVLIKVYTKLFDPATPFGKAIIYIAVSVTTILVCFGIYYTLKKLFPRVLAVFTGDR